MIKFCAKISGKKLIRSGSFIHYVMIKNLDKLKKHDFAI